MKADMTKSMPRHELWRMEYRKRPYLRNAPADVLAARFRDVMSNIALLTEEGKIGVNLDRSHMEYWTSRFTHLLEEYGRRGGIPSNAGLASTVPTPTYPEIPRGVAALREANRFMDRPFLAKFMKIKYAEQLVYQGKLRVSPASSYNDPSLNQAINDDELTVSCFLPKEEVAMSSIDKQTGKPHLLNATTDLKVNIKAKTDYYVWCMAESTPPRLFQDFDADACVLILNPKLFIARIRDAMSDRTPKWDFSVRKVKYIDPYLTNPNDIDPFGCKHFRYYYQQEIRLIWLPRVPHKEKLHPQFIEMGPLHDICVLVDATTDGSNSDSQENNSPS